AVLPVPHIAVFVVFALCILFLAHLEGLQVAILVAEAKDPEPYAESSPRAYALMRRATYEKNVRRFLIGRQFFVIFVVFLINQCTIFPEITHFGINSAVWFVFVQLGFPTALNVLCFGQLPAQLLANQDPVLFMNRYGPRFTLEATWFRITASAIQEIEQYKDLEAVKRGVATSATADASSAVNTSIRGKDDQYIGMMQSQSEDPETGGEYHTDELNLEMHSDVSHAYNL
ncbi:SIT, partial [Symbiodinium microadriaticum]